MHIMTNDDYASCTTILFITISRLKSQTMPKQEKVLEDCETAN